LVGENDFFGFRGVSWLRGESVGVGFAGGVTGSFADLVGVFAGQSVGEDGVDVAGVDVAGVVVGEPVCWWVFEVRTRDEIT
jgi:hypothetical protein